MTNDNHMPGTELLDLISGETPGQITIDSHLVPEYTHARFRAELEAHRLSATVEFEVSYNSYAQEWIIAWRPSRKWTRRSVERVEGSGNPGLST